MLADSEPMRRRHHFRQPIPHRLMFLLVGVLCLLIIWLAANVPWHWRAHQYIDVGSALDHGYVSYFSTREASLDDPSLTFRWSQSWSSLHPWTLPPDRTALLTLTMAAPPQPDGPQEVRVSAGERPLTDIALTVDMRVYQLLLPPQQAAEQRIVLESPPLVLNDPDDARELGVALDSARIVIPGPPTLLDLLHEFWTAPWLPVGLLLLVLWALLIRLPLLLVAGLPALLLAALAGLEWLVPGIGLPLAVYVSVASGILLLVAVGHRVLQRLPRLYPASDRAALVWLLGGWALLLLITFDPLVNSDGVGYYVYLRSVTMDGDLQFANDFAAPIFSRAPWSMPVTSTGHWSNPWSVGPALVWAPLYGVAHLLVLAGQSMGIPWQADGFASPYIVLSMLGSALAGLLAMLVTYRLCRRFVAPPAAVLAVLSVVMGSNLLFYFMREGSFAHAISAATASLFLLAWFRLEEQPSVARWAQLGAAAGIMVLVYWISALLLLLPALTFARLTVRALRGEPGQRKQRLKGLALGSVSAAGLCILLFTPQMLAWTILYGSPLTIPQGEGFASPSAFVWRDFFLSTLHGVLLWAPAFVAGIVGLLLLWPRNRWLAVCLLLCVGLYLWYNASIPNWHGSGAFGPRRLTLLMPWFAIGLALLYVRLSRWHVLLPTTLAAIMVGWTTLLLVRYHLFLLPRDIHQLYAMPAQAFFLGSNALPVQRLPSLMYDSYFWQTVQQLPALASGLELAAVLLVCGAGCWSAASVFWYTRPNRIIPLDCQVTTPTEQIGAAHSEA